MCSGTSNYDNIIEIHSNVESNLPTDAKKGQAPFDNFFDILINNIIVDMQETCDSISELLGNQSQIYTELTALCSSVPTWLVSGVSNKALPIKGSVEELFPDVCVDMSPDPKESKPILEIIKEYVDALCFFQAKQDELQIANERLIGYIEQFIAISKNEDGKRRLLQRQDEIVGMLKGLIEHYNNIV